MFSWQSKKSTARASYVDTWDQSLYEVLFVSRAGRPFPRTHRFECRLSSRTSILDPAVGALAEHRYTGSYVCWLSEQEYCSIPVHLAFEAPDENYDLRINEFAIGYLLFSVTLDHRSQPTFEIVVKNRGMLRRASR
jgi:hypothetical protein